MQSSYASLTHICRWAVCTSNFLIPIYTHAALHLFLECICNLTAILVHFKLFWLIKSARCVFEQEKDTQAYTDTQKQAKRNTTLEPFFHIWHSFCWSDIISSCLKRITALITQLNDTTIWSTVVTAILRGKKKNTHFTEMMIWQSPVDSYGHYTWFVAKK